VELAGFWLWDIYFLEDLDYLAEHLTRLFGGTDWRQRVDDSLAGLTGLSGARVGHLVRDHHRFVLGTRALLRALPEEVEVVTVSIRKVLGSMFVLTLEVRLGPRASERVLSLQSELRGDIIEIRRRSYWLRSLVTRPAEEAIRRAVAGYILELKTEVRQTVLGRAPGRLATGSAAASDDPGSLDLYFMRGQSVSPDSFDEWTREHAAWLSTLDVDLRRHTAFITDGLAFAGVPRLGRFPPRPALLLVLWEQFLNSRPRYNQNGDDLNEVMLGIQETAWALSETLPLKVWLSSVNARLLEHRRLPSIREELRSRPASIGVDVALATAAARDHARVARSSTEYFANRGLLTHSWHALAQLEMVQYHPDASPLDLRESVLGALDANFKLLRSHFRVAIAGQDALLQLRSMRVSYSLQRAIAGLTFVAAIAAVVGMIGLREELGLIFRYVLEQGRLVLSWVSRAIAAMPGT